MQRQTQVLQDLKDLLDEYTTECSRYKQRETELLREISDLKGYADLSVVKSLTAENAELKNELTFLRRKLQNDDAQSRASVSSKVQPKVVPKQQEHPSAQVLQQQEQQKQEQQKQQQQSMQLKQQEQQKQQQQSMQLKQQEERQALPQLKQEQSLHSGASETSRATKGTQRTLTAGAPPVTEVKMPEQPSTKDHEERSEGSEEDYPELLPLSLNSGDYFWDPVNGNLYSVLSEDDAGELVGKLKVVKIRGAPYYIDTVDNTVYEQLKGGEIGNKCGSLVNNKAVFDRKQPAAKAQ